jgi:hypothetical protein
MVVGERKLVAVSMNLFAIAATAFLVGLAVVFVIFTAKYIRTRVGGRGPLGLFAHPRHTYAQYDDDQGEGDGMGTEGGGARTGGDLGGDDGRNPG